MRDLVVAREGRVDRGPALEHVREDAVHDQVAHDDAHGGAHEGIEAAAVPSGTDVAADRAECRGPLEEDLPEEEHEHARHVEPVREERAVAGVRALLGLHSAHGEDHVLCLSREEVPAARAAVRQQPDAGGMTTLELGAVRGCGARHRRRRRLLDPAERGDVLVRAEEDPRLTRAGLRGEVGLPLGEAMVAVGDPAGHVRRVAVPHRALQDGEREPVDLEKHDPGDVGLDALARSASDPLDHPQRVRVVVVRPEEDVEDDRDGGGDERGQERPPEAVHLDRVVREGRRSEEHERVEDEDDEEAEDERQRQLDRRDDRQDQCVQDGDDERDDDRAQEGLDLDVRHDPGRDEERGGRDEPGHEELERLDLRPDHPLLRCRGLRVQETPPDSWRGVREY